MTKTNSPIQYFGGKATLAKRLIDLFPAHHTYVEPFAGSGAVLLTKKPSPVEVYNDLDEGVVNFFRVLRDPLKAARLQFMAGLTPYSRREFEQCRATWHESEDDVERAHRWFTVARMSFAGLWGSSFGTTVSTSTRGMAQRNSAYLNGIATMAAASERLMRVQIDHQDFRKLIPRYDRPDTLFYLDPPYVPQTRRDGRYRCEMEPEDHQQLVDLLIKLEGKAILSGYDHPIYQPLVNAGWTTRRWNTHCWASGRTKAMKHQKAKERGRVEVVWLSPGIERRRLQIAA